MGHTRHTHHGVVALMTGLSDATKLPRPQNRDRRMGVKLLLLQLLLQLQLQWLMSSRVTAWGVIPHQHPNRAYTRIPLAVQRTNRQLQRHQLLPSPDVSSISHRYASSRFSKSTLPQAKPIPGRRTGASPLLLLASTNPTFSTAASNDYNNGIGRDNTDVSGSGNSDESRILNTNDDATAETDTDAGMDATQPGVLEPPPELEAWRMELSAHDLNRLETTAKNAARAAGEIIARAAQFTEETGSPPSVPLYDRQAQVAIQTVIGMRYPTQWFLQGKTNAPEPMATPMGPNPSPDTAAVQSAVLQSSASTSDIFWIYDPIDGTANFAAGLELSAVTMAVVYKGTVVVSCIYDPYQDEMFTAVKGRGAFLNDVHRLSVNKDVVTELSDAIVNTGIPDSTPLSTNAAAASFPVAMRGVRALNGHARGVRMMACNALATAWIAAGRLSAHICYDVNSWDLAAGALLIQEAGGRVSDLYGLPFVLSTRNVLCSNELVHDTILDILDGADAVFVDNRSF